MVVCTLEWCGVCHSPSFMFNITLLPGDERKLLRNYYFLQAELSEQCEKLKIHRSYTTHGFFII